MTDHKKISTDEGLKDNEQMEQAILTLQQNPTQEMLAHVLTIVRRRMRAHGQLIVAGATCRKFSDAFAGHSDG